LLLYGFDADRHSAAGGYHEEDGLRFRTVAGTVGVLAGLTALNRRLKKVGDPALIGGEERRYSWRCGELAYRVAGEPEAQPLLLVHGIYAGASSYEFRKNFHELVRNFRVYALDLLGCGHSERPQRRYEPEDVAAQVEDFAREEIRAPCAHDLKLALGGAPRARRGQEPAALQEARAHLPDRTR